MKPLIQRTKFKQGKFIPRHPEKYIGDITNIVYRSSWEAKFFLFCDINESVLKWGSEELKIPYMNPLDNNIHQYFIDLVMIVKTINGPKKFAVEIKPYKETQVPSKNSSMKTKTTYITNISKWKAAVEYCNKMNITFKILTEKELFKNGE